MKFVQWARGNPIPPRQMGNQTRADIPLCAARGCARRRTRTARRCFKGLLIKRAPPRELLLLGPDANRGPGSIAGFEASFFAEEKGEGERRDGVLALLKIQLC